MKLAIYWEACISGEGNQKPHVSATIMDDRVGAAVIMSWSLFFFADAGGEDEQPLERRAGIEEYRHASPGQCGRGRCVGVIAGGAEGTSAETAKRGHPVAPAVRAADGTFGRERISGDRRGAVRGVHAGRRRSSDNTVLLTFDGGYASF